MRPGFRFAPVLLATLLPLAAHANTICCDMGGQTWCDDGLPPACAGKAYRVLNSNGTLLRQVAAPLTPEQQAKHDAELAQQKIEAQKRLELEQQDRKLLSTYPTFGDLDFAQNRSLNDMQKSQQQMEQRLAALEKQQQKLANDAAFYGAKHPMPAQLKLQIGSTDKDIQAQKDAIAARMQEMSDAQKRFEAEKQRYMQLSDKVAP